jgi:hypothetical protein
MDKRFVVHPAFLNCRFYVINLPCINPTAKYRILQNLYMLSPKWMKTSFLPPSRSPQCPTTTYLCQRRGEGFDAKIKGRRK